MISVTKLGSAGGSAAYYARDDYYLNVDDPQDGRLTWGGKLAAFLGLKGEVKADDLRSVLDGRNPDPDGPALSRFEAIERENALQSGERAIEGDSDHEPEPRSMARDITYSSPKSFSIQGEVGEDEAVIKSHDEAVQFLAEFIEDYCTVTRLRENGSEPMERLAGSALFASVRHATSRSLDPQTHTHLLLSSSVQMADGSIPALHSPSLYQHQRLFDRMAQEVQAASLRDAGFNTRPGKTAGTYELAEVTDNQIRHFSRRGDQIETQLGEAEAALGRELSVKEARAMRLVDRPGKQEVDGDELKAEWRERASDHKIDLAGISKAARERGQGRHMLPEKVLDRLVSTAIGLVRPQQIQASSPQGAMAEGLAHMEERQAVFTRLDLLEAAYKAAINYSHSPKAMLDAMKSMECEGTLLAADKDIVLGVTTQRALDIEKAMLSELAAVKGQGASFGHDSIDGLLTKEGLQKLGIEIVPNASQEAAVKGILTSQDGVVGLLGFAGVGKTTTVRLLDQSVRQLSGEGLIGLAASSNAVNELKASAGLEGRTIASFLMAYDNAVKNGQLEALKRNHEGRWLLIDESSQVGNKTMGQILEAKKALNIEKVVLSGDPRQLSAPSAGAPLQLMSHHGLEHYTITEIVRQNNEQLRGAIFEMAQGRPSAAFQQMLPFIRETGERSQSSLLSAGLAAWKDKRAQGIEATVVVATNADANHMNAAVRHERIKAGDVAEKGHVQGVLRPVSRTKSELANVSGYARGQTLVVYKGDKDFGTHAGDRLTVSKMDVRNNRLEVKDPKGNSRSLYLSELRDGDRLNWSLAESAQIEIAFGDRMMWNANNKGRNIYNNGLFTVTEITRNLVTVEQADGAILQIAKSDPILQHINHAYAMTADRAQGQSHGDTIAILSSTSEKMASHARAYVMASRPKEDLILVTNDAKQLFRRLAANDGVNKIAIEHLNEQIELAKAGTFMSEAKRVSNEAPRLAEPLMPLQEPTLLRDSGIRPVQAELDLGAQPVRTPGTKNIGPTAKEYTNEEKTMNFPNKEKSL